MKIPKVIQISSTSPSFFLSSGKGNIEAIFKGEWSAQFAKQIKKFNNNLRLECWSPEKNWDKQRNFSESGVLFRTFPSTFAVRPSMDISLAMLKELNNEIINSEKENIKLILHFHEYHSWQIYTILLFLKKSKNVKIFAQHHGGRSPLQNLLKYKRLFVVFPAILLMQLCENHLFKKINTFYALSLDEINYLKKITLNSNIKFQTMGIEDNYFEKVNKKIARKKLGLDLNKKYIMYLGRIKTTKGIKELLDAMKNINAELLLLGGGQDSEKYKNYVIENNMNNVNFLGAIYNDKKLDYFSACDCLVLPSYTEGAPVVIMEAIARNLPVVVTDVGGVSMMIKNNREGIIIKPYSVLDIVEGVNKVLKWQHKNIRRYAEKYRWKYIIDDTIKDYIS